VEHPTTLVLGLGNDLVTDDGFGPAVARAAALRLQDLPDVRVMEASVAGFHLLDLLNGFERVLIIDVVQTGRHAPGTLLVLPPERASAGRTLGGSHQMDLTTALSFGRSVGYELSESITLLAAEAKDLLTIQEQMSPELSAVVPRATDLVCRWIEGGDELILERGRSCDHDRVVS
jgi:hydrogenase maturation protease